MKRCLFSVGLLLIATLGITSETNKISLPKDQPMTSASLGYVVLYVKDVSASLAFYEKAFGLTRRFFNDENGKAYGELETGAARIAFASISLASDHVKQELVTATPDKAPLGFEVALVTTNVPELFARAVKAGAAPISEPDAKPWGQTVAYVRDNNGFLVALCTPLP